MDTIYAQVNDASNPTEIEVLYIAGLEFVGGGVPAGTPAITKPSGTTLNLGTNYGSGVSAQVEIKGRDLTGDLTVTVGTGLTISYGQTLNGSSVTIPLANALAGALVTVAYSGSGALDDGSLVISGGGATPKSVVVVVDAWTEVDLTQNVVNAWIGADGKWSSSGNNTIQHCSMIAASNLSKIKITANSTNKSFFLFLKSVPNFPTSVAYASYLCSGETGRREQAAGTTQEYNIPSDCVSIQIGIEANGGVTPNAYKPSYVGVM